MVICPKSWEELSGEGFNNFWGSSNRVTSNVVVLEVVGRYWYVASSKAAVIGLFLLLNIGGNIMGDKEGEEMS